MIAHRFSPLATIVVLLFLSIGTSGLRAQEVQAPFDDAGKIIDLTAELEQKLRLFPDIPGFRSAALYKLPDSSFALEILNTENDKQMKKRTLLTASEVAVLRHRVGDSVAARLPSAGLDQSGRADMLIGSSLLSLGYYGWSVPVAFDMEDRALIGTYMFIGASGFFLPYALTSNSRVTSGDAALSVGLGTMGIGHGILGAFVIGGEDVSYKTMLLSGTVVSVGEFVAGYYIADGTKMSAGKADVITIGGMFGMLMGAQISGSFGFYNQNEDARAGTALPLLVSGLGIYGGNALANAESYTTGDASILADLGLLGAYVPLSAVNLISNSDASERHYFGASFFGTCAGLTLGHLLVKGKDFSRGDAALITLGEGSGMLLGAGFAYLVTSDNQENPGGTYLTATALGGIGGFALMYGLLAKNAEVHDTRTGSNWNVHFSPDGLTGYLLRDKLSLPASTSFQMLSVSAKF